MDVAEILQECNGGGGEAKGAVATCSCPASNI